MGFSRKFRSTFLVLSVILIILIASLGAVQALGLANPGFESGLTGWNASGDVTAGPAGNYLSNDRTWTVGPYQTQMAILAPDGSSGQFPTVADALGLSADSRSYLTGVFPVITNMAYVSTDITLAAGESFTMAWNYVATDYEPFNDASFCSLVNLGNPADVPFVNSYHSQVSILGATVRGTGNYSTGSYGSTGWQTATFQATSAGNYRLGFAVYNLDDTALNPYLFVDRNPGTTLLNGSPFDPIPPDDNPPPPPSTTVASVSTGSASLVTTASATVGGEVTSDGGETVTERGIVYGTTAAPTTADGKVAAGSGTGSFNAAISSLTPGTRYYARAYAINSNGTAYGTDVSFVTVPPAPVAAAAASVTGSGFTATWQTAAGATGYRLDVATDEAFTQLVSGYSDRNVGNATSQAVSGLSPVTAYYYRVRASNSSGTGASSNTVSAVTVKGNQTISFPAMLAVTYGASDLEPGATASSGLPVSYQSDDSGVATIVDGRIHLTGAGSVMITATQAGSSQWNPAPEQQKILTVNPRTLTIGGTLAVADKPYDGQAGAVVDGDQLSLVGIVGSDSVTLDPAAVFADADAAPGKSVHLTADSAISGPAAGSYLLSLSGAPTGTASILPRTLTLSGFAADDKVYDGTLAAVNARFADDRLTGDGLTFSYLAEFADRNAGSDVPVHFSGIAISGGADAGNYTLAGTSGSAAADIGARPITVGAAAAGKTYGDADPALTWSLTAGSLAGLDAPTGALARAPGNAVGTYAIGVGTLGFGSNYAVTFTGNWLTVSARPITVSATAAGKTYGDADPELTWSVTAGSLSGLDAPTGALARAAGEVVGSYAIGIGTLDFGSNYSVTFSGASLVIGQRPLTIRAVSAGKTYGEADPAWTAAMANLATWDDEAAVHGLTISREPGETVGTYALTPAGGTADNYDITFEAGVLTIGRRPLTLTAVAATKDYGTGDPALAYEVTAGSLVFGDGISGSQAREPGENVGEYAILQSTLTAGGNYSLTYVPAVLTIKPYAEAETSGSVRNGSDPDNDGQVSYLAEPASGHGFAYWSDGSTVYCSRPELLDPVGGIAPYSAIFWPTTSATEIRAAGLSSEQGTDVSLLGGALKMLLPARSDREAVVAATPFSTLDGNQAAPAGLMPAGLYYRLQRSENLDGQVIRIEIRLDQAGVRLSGHELESLRLYRWDEEQQAWATVHVLSQGIDAGTGVFWAEIDHFSTFGLFYEPTIIITGERLASLPWLLLLVAGGIVLALLLKRRIAELPESGR